MFRRTKNLCRFGDLVYAHHHAESNLLSAVFLFDRLVQYNVQEDLCLSVLHALFLRFVLGLSHIVSTEHADDFAAAVKLDKEPLVEILASSVR